MKTLRPEGLSYSEESSSGELCDQVEFAAEQQGEREGIERQSGRELRGLKPACREMFLPLAEALVVVRQRDAVRAVSNPVHGPQRRVVEGILTQVIFQDNVGARNTRGFAKKLRNVGGMVEHIHKEACVKGSIWKGELRPIERAAGKPASGPRNHFHAFDGEIGPPLGEQAADCAVAATDIEHAVHFGRNQRGQRIRKNPRPAPKDEGAMAAGDPGERPGLWRGSHQIGSACEFFHIP